MNKKPESDYVLVFVSDWLKDHFGFYAYISLTNYEEDIQAIHELKKRLNKWGTDIYVEMIDHSSGLKDFYTEQYNRDTWAHWHILDPDTWKAAGF